MKALLNWLKVEGNRWYLYTVLLGLVPLLVVYGLLSNEQAAAWIGLGLAALGLDQARRNVDRKSR